MHSNVFVSWGQMIFSRHVDAHLTFMGRAIISKLIPAGFRWFDCLPVTIGGLDFVVILTAVRYTQWSELAIYKPV